MSEPMTWRELAEVEAFVCDDSEPTVHRERAGRLLATVNRFWGEREGFRLQAEQLRAAIAKHHAQKAAQADTESALYSTCVAVAKALDLEAWGLDELAPAVGRLREQVASLDAAVARAKQIMERVRAVCDIRTHSHMSYSGRRYEEEMDEFLAGAGGVVHHLLHDRPHDAQ